VKNTKSFGTARKVSDLGLYTGFSRVENKMASSNLHLVDDEGRPLDPRVEEAITRHEKGVRRKFAKYCDPAAFSNAIEAKGSRIAKSLRDGRAAVDSDIVGAITWRSLFNLGISFVRKRKAEQRAEAEFARILTEIHKSASHSEAIIAREDGLKILSQLSERDRLMCHLESQDLSVPQIAAYLKISEAAVRQARSRRKKKVAELISRKDAAKR
jgi:hypothetical protein